MSCQCVMIRIIAMERVVRSNKRLRMILLGGNMTDKEIGLKDHGPGCGVMLKFNVPFNVPIGT